MPRCIGLSVLLLGTAQHSTARAHAFMLMCMPHVPAHPQVVPQLHAFGAHAFIEEHTFRKVFVSRAGSVFGALQVKALCKPPSGHTHTQLSEPVNGTRNGLQAAGASLRRGAEHAACRHGAQHASVILLVENISSRLQQELSYPSGTSSRSAPTAKHLRAAAVWLLSQPRRLSPAVCSLQGGWRQPSDTTGPPAQHRPPRRCGCCVDALNDAACVVKGGTARGHGGMRCRWRVLARRRVVAVWWCAALDVDGLADANGCASVDGLFLLKPVGVLAVSAVSTHAVSAAHTEAEAGPVGTAAWPGCHRLDPTTNHRDIPRGCVHRVEGVEHQHDEEENAQLPGGVKQGQRQRAAGLEDTCSRQQGDDSEGRASILGGRAVSIGPQKQTGGQDSHQYARAGRLAMRKLLSSSEAAGTYGKRGTL